MSALDGFGVIGVKVGEMRTWRNIAAVEFDTAQQRRLARREHGGASPSLRHFRTETPKCDPESRFREGFVRPGSLVIRLR